jgi:hypothetical protein
MATRFEQIAGLTPLEAADEILRGVRKDSPRILVGRDARALALLVRLFPVAYYRILGALARRSSRALLP